MRKVIPQTSFTALASAAAAMAAALFVAFSPGPVLAAPTTSKVEARPGGDGRLGITFKPVTANLNGSAVPAVEVVAVHPNSSFAKGQLTAGDRIIALQGVSFASADLFLGRVQALKPGSEVSLTVMPVDGPQVIQISGRVVHSARVTEQVAAPQAQAAGQQQKVDDTSEFVRHARARIQCEKENPKLVQNSVAGAVGTKAGGAIGAAICPLFFVTVAVGDPGIAPAVCMLFFSAGGGGIGLAASNSMLEEKIERCTRERLKQ